MHSGDTQLLIFQNGISVIVRTMHIFVNLVTYMVGNH